MAWGRSSSAEAGFSLTETLVSVGILAAVSLGVAQMFAVATDANRAAQVTTSAATLAAQKMEQLRGLTWGFDSQGLPVTDTTTNLANEPPTNDGRGLNPSPGGTLDANTPGYVDYLDRSGAWVGTGPTPPPNAIFIRRWSVDPLPTNPNNTLVLQVLVTTVAREAARGSGPKQRLPGDAWIVSVKTRKAP
ncbi:MAG TPA: hypothetical protein VNK92_01460 [Vicinamibacterales bacterium]|jgi:type II secretory pathway pseudopilin PulG|nr:hypothetical protein [Vicinamibacterales bacterium]